MSSLFSFENYECDYICETISLSLLSLSVCVCFLSLLFSQPQPSPVAAFYIILFAAIMPRAGGGRGKKQGGGKGPNAVKKTTKSVRVNPNVTDWTTSTIDNIAELDKMVRTKLKKCDKCASDVRALLLERIRSVYKEAQKGRFQDLESVWNDVEETKSTWLNVEEANIDVRHDILDHIPEVNHQAMRDIVDVEIPAEGDGVAWALAMQIHGSRIGRELRLSHRIYKTLKDKTDKLREGVYRVDLRSEEIRRAATKKSSNNDKVAVVVASSFGTDEKFKKVTIASIMLNDSDLSNKDREMYKRHLVEAANDIGRNYCDRTYIQEAISKGFAWFGAKEMNKMMTQAQRVVPPPTVPDQEMLRRRSDDGHQLTVDVSDDDDEVQIVE